MIFTIDPSQSSETFSGVDNTYGAIGPSNTLSASVSGHFLVNFDTSTDTPSSIQFEGASGGFYTLATPYTLSPGVGGTGPAAPANLGGSAGAVSFALRNLAYDFNSSAVTPTNSTGSTTTYSANNTSYQVLSGAFDYVNGNAGTVPETGATGPLTGGTWTLTDSPAHSGNWTLSLTNGTVPVPYNFTSVGGTSGSLTATGNVVATAQYTAANNTASVPASASTASALGGSSTPGGVTVDFNGNTTGGTLTVQQVPNLGGTSQAAVAAAQANPTFVLSTEALSGTPQIWTVNYPDSAVTGPVTIVFHYDPTGLTLAQQEQLVIWHFDTTANGGQGGWVSGGTVDTANDTIAFTTSTFSPFELGVQVVPEPSTIVLLIGGGVGLVTVALRRRRYQDRRRI